MSTPIPFLQYTFLLILVKIFELATNEPLFPLDTFGITREEIDNDHCTLIEKRLGLNNQDADFAEYLRERLPENFGAENA